MHRAPRLAGLAIGLSLLVSVAGARATTIDFDGLADSTVVTNQFPGVAFGNAIVLTAGVSLNEFEFPPRSGANVALDGGGAISIGFAVPVASFGAYFTYTTRLTLTAFDAGSNAIASTISAFETNAALSGEPGAAPNEWMQVVFPGGISSIAIAGAPLGGSFTMDDASYDAVPEPATLGGVFGGLVLLGALRSSRRARRR